MFFWSWRAKNLSNEIGKAKSMTKFILSIVRKLSGIGFQPVVNLQAGSLCYIVSIFALTTFEHFGNEARAQDEADIAFQLPQDPPDPKAGQLLEWEGWSFRWQFRDIEGLMLSDVYFRGRKVLKAINLAEIYVPYAPGEPRPEDFSLGGFSANPMPLQIGRDCNTAGTSCRPFNRDGTPAKGPTADVMIHEEPIGFLYAGSQGRAPGKMLVL